MMKTKKLFYLLSLASILSVNTFAYDECRNYYEDENYDDAIECYKNTAHIYEDVSSQLYWAKSEEKLKHYDYAIAAYERVVSLEPSNIEATMALVKLYKKNSQNELAKETIEAFDDKDLTPSQRTSLLQLLSLDTKQLSKFTARVVTKLGYDTNIASSSSHNDEEGSIFSQTIAALSYIHDLDEKGGWFARADAAMMLQIYTQNYFFNTTYFKASAALGYKDGDTTYTIPFYISNTHYLEQNLLQNFGITPTYSSVLNPSYILNVALNIDVRSYVPSSMSSYDSQTFGINSSLYYIQGSNYISAKIFFDETIASNTQESTSTILRYIDNSRFGLELYSLYRISPKYLLNVKYKLSHSIYKQNLASQNTQRTDTYQNLGLTLSRYIFKSLKATLDYSYANNTTEYLLSDYDKHIMSIGIEYNY